MNSLNVGSVKFFLIVLPFISFSQYPPMPTIWEIILPYNITKSGYDEKTNKYWIAGDENISVLNPDNGKVIWSKTFRNISSKLNIATSIIPIYETHSLLIINEDVIGNYIFLLSLEDGKLLWQTNKYGIRSNNIIYIKEVDALAYSSRTELILIKSKTGEELWKLKKFRGDIGAYKFDTLANTLTFINYKPSTFSVLETGFKNQMCKVNALNGQIIWENNFKCKVEKDFYIGNPVVDFWTEKDKLFLILDGLRVFNFKTGELIWNVRYKTNVKTMRATVYEGVSIPLMDSTGVYIYDKQYLFSQFLRKYNINSGEIIWSSEEISNAKIIPSIYSYKNIIIIQIGGIAEMFNNDGTVLRRLEFGPYGLKAFDSKSGKIIWESERFKKGITNSVLDKENLIVSSGKALYKLNAETGNELYEIGLNTKLIGNIINLVKYKDLVIIIGEQGMSSYNISNGFEKWNLSLKKGQFNGVIGQMAFYSGENGDLYAVNIETGLVKLCDATKNSTFAVSLNGTSLYITERRKVIKKETF